jgi:hypothetical protein
VRLSLSLLLLLTPQKGEADPWPRLVRTGMFSAAASLGLSLLWDTDVGLSHIDKYAYAQEDNIKVRFPPFSLTFLSSFFLCSTPSRFLSPLPQRSGNKANLPSYLAGRCHARQRSHSLGRQDGDGRGVGAVVGAR